MRGLCFVINSFDTLYHSQFWLRKANVPTLRPRPPVGCGGGVFYGLLEHDDIRGRAGSTPMRNMYIYIFVDYS